MKDNRGKPRILLVEDEPKVIYLVREILSAAGYDVITTPNGQNAIECVAVEQPELIVLDIVLSGNVDGYEVTRRLREFSDIPIIMLTGKVREIDLLRGFEVGADDYITKPFHAKELLARIDAVIKRSRRDQAHMPVSKIRCDDLCIDLALHKVTLGNHEVHLTVTEFNLLKELALHKNQVMVHEELLTSVWGTEYRNDLDYLRAYIYNLRKKIEKDPANPKIIVRCPGVGYIFSCPEE